MGTTEYLIVDRDGIVFGVFASKFDRDEALRKYCEYGIPRERVI